MANSNVFCHGPFYWIYLVTYLGGSIYVLWSGYQVRCQYQNRNKIVLSLLLAFLLLSIAMNQIDKSVKSAWLTVAIVVTLFYIFYNDISRENVRDTVRTVDSIMYHNMERNKIKYGPILRPIFQEDTPSVEHVLMESQQSPSMTLDTSGLADWTFTVFSSTSERGYIYLCNMNTMDSARAY